jgi:diguanylate cyclase (GGDEF)-like protein/PAS domain S-box-containing protein
MQALPMPRSFSILVELLKLLSVAALYSLLGQLSLTYLSAGTFVSVVWPPSGLALAVILTGGKRYAWGVFLGALLTSATASQPLGAAIAIAMGNTLEPLIAAWLLKRDGKFDAALNTWRDYLIMLLLSAFCGVTVGALTVTTALQLSGTLGAETFFQNMLYRWMGDVFGIMLISPLILIWRQAPRDWLKPQRALEAMLLLGLTFLVSQLVFLGWLDDSIGDKAKGYWMFLFVTWAAVRFGTHGVTLVLLMTTVQAMLGAVLGMGYFGNDLAETSLTNFWSFMAILSGVGMTLATYFTERTRVEQALRTSEATQRLIISASPVPLFLQDAQQNITFVNAAFTQTFGYQRDDIPNIADWRSKAYPDPVYRQWVLDTWQTALENVQPDGKTYRPIELDITCKDHSVKKILASAHAVDNTGGAVRLIVLYDITDLKAAQVEIEYLAFYDSLTQLPNRRLLQDRLKQALASSARNKSHGALLFIDLDNFKSLNDTRGHDMGDLLLQQVAQRLVSCVREGDTVARLGGDEFVVMLEELSEIPADAAAQTETVGKTILAALTGHYQLNSYEHRSTPSIGVTLFSGHHQSTDELLRRADLAMYQAKAAGRNTLRFFDPIMQAAVTARVVLEADLREALRQKQFYLCYQPQVDGTGDLTGAEALLRWRHPQRGLVSPAEFIPMAEETGLILPLGHWVLETACAQLQTWSMQPETTQLTLAVNVSARQFHHPTFVEQVLAVLDHTGIRAEKLKLELTESLLLGDVEDTIAKMTALKARGVVFSLDDFGTGYSSLAYLKRLPLDQLKIDQSFVRDIFTDTNDAVIIRTIVNLGHSLGLSVIAEGVETPAQHDFLAAQGCHAFQGYLFGRPVPIDQFQWPSTPGIANSTAAGLALKPEDDLFS